MLAFLQNAVTYVVPFLIVLTLIVTIHELGHFLTARLFGVAIDRFSIGFGRAVASWRDRAGTEWRIGWIPVGGYVKFAGDENAASVPDQRDLTIMRAEIGAREGAGAEGKYLVFKPLWQRALIVAAGPTANFLLAIVIFSAIFATIGRAVTPFSVATVQSGSAAQHAGLQVGDRILAADGHRIEGFEELASYVTYRDGVAIDFTVLRGLSRLHIVATPGSRQVQAAFGGLQTVGLLGITPHAESEWRYRRENPIAAVGSGVRETWQVLSTTVFYLGRILTGQANVGQLHSVFGIAKATGAITQQAIDQSPRRLGDQVFAVVVNLAGFAALISVSIGFMNLLPLPVLDGGHLLFYAYEWVAGRPVATAVQSVGYRVGLALLVGLMLFATWNDLQRLRVFRIFGSLFS
jgi:regulator of sigma E protease